MEEAKNIVRISCVSSGVWNSHDYGDMIPVAEVRPVMVRSKAGQIAVGCAGLMNWNRGGPESGFRVTEWCEISEGLESHESILEPMSAPEFCEQAMNLMTERGKTYDSQGGEQERSMGKTIQAFNAITGRDLKESEGWLIQSILKRVRQYANPKFHRDSAEDAVAYSALEAESLAQEGDNA